MILHLTGKLKSNYAGITNNNSYLDKDLYFYSEDFLYVYIKYQWDLLSKTTVGIKNGAVVLVLKL